MVLGMDHHDEWVSAYPFEAGASDTRTQIKSKGDIVIGSDVWIGTGATILSGITIGLGWPGCKDTDALQSTDNIVAFCDVDTTRAPDFRKRYPKVKSFVDYRKMFDEMQKGIDAVIEGHPVDQLLELARQMLADSDAGRALARRSEG